MSEFFSNLGGEIVAGVSAAVVAIIFGLWRRAKRRAGGKIKNWKRRDW